MKKFLSLITCFLLISSVSAFESYSFSERKQTEEKTNEKYNLGAKLIEDENKVIENSAISKKESELLKNQKDLQDKNKANNENINKTDNEKTSKNNVSIEHKDKPKNAQKIDQISNLIQERLLMPITININNVTFEYLFNHISNYVKVSIVMRNFESDSSGTFASTTSTTTQIGGNSRILPITVSYYATNKPLKLVLDELCGMYDLTWKIEDYRIVIYRYEEKVFQVKLPILEKSISLTDDALTLKYQKDFYQNLETSLKSLLKDGSSKITINNMGYIAVRARPSEIRIVEQTVDRINKYFTSTIPLRITVLVVRLNNSNTTGLNLFNIQFNRDKTTNKQTIDVSRDNKLNLTGVLNLSFKGIFKNWSLESVFQTLSEYGDTKVVEDLHMRALNYQPLIWKPQKKQRIISNFQLNYMSTTQTGGTSGSASTVPQVTTQTEDIDEGSNLIIVPYYLTDDGEQIVVDMYRNQKEIIELVNWNVNLGEGGSNTIILPKVQTYSDVQQSVIKRGEGIVIVSSTVTQESLKKSGIPFLQNIPIIGYLFGTTTKETDRFQIVITIGYEG
jgi:type II secretory pathway component GspD/PulD (secretin)